MGGFKEWVHGFRDGYIYIYCLPPAGGRFAPTAPLRDGGRGRGGGGEGEGRVMKLMK
jgi:hypothetical protein